MSTVSAPTATEKVELRVSDGTRMFAYVARPPKPLKSGPGIIVLQEAFGVTGYLREVAARFANELGFTAIAPELYHRTGDGAVGNYDTDQPSDMNVHRAGLSTEGQAADFVAAWEWLRKEGVPAERTAAVGFCMGGRVAFLGNAHVPLGAAISFYGGNIPKWADFAPKEHGPILFFWAGLDHHITAEQRRAVEDAMITAKSVQHTHVVFSDADHGFFCHARPSVYHPGAAREAWAMLVEFLKYHKVID